MVVVVEQSVEAPALLGDACHRLLTSFGGVEAGQAWVDYWLWELVLNDRPDLRSIVEIGTWEGGFSRYLQAQASLRGMRFVTYDAVEPKRPPEAFVRLDVFANPEQLIPGPWKFEVEEAPYEPLVLLCDGGNKPREMALFAPMLHAGSLLIVHDWLTEVGPDDVPDGLTEVYADVCEALGSMSRVFEVGR